MLGLFDKKPLDKKRDRLADKLPDKVIARLGYRQFMRVINQLSPSHQARQNSQWQGRNIMGLQQYLRLSSGAVKAKIATQKPETILSPVSPAYLGGFDLFCKYNKFQNQDF